MMIFKILAASFIVMTPLFGFAITKIFKLDRYKINFADLALPLFIFEIVIVSQKFFVHSFLPHYLCLMSLLAIGVAIGLFRKNKSQFSYKRFFKFFWRTGFIASLLFYIALVIAIFVI